MYLRDIFGRPLWEDVEVPDRLGPEGEVLIPAHIERRQKRNPDYDGSQTYQPRSQRPEWDAVGLLGKLVAVAGPVNPMAGRQWVRAVSPWQARRGPGTG